MTRTKKTGGFGNEDPGFRFPHHEGANGTDRHGEQKSAP